MSRFSSSDRHCMFEDVDRWGPLTSFNRHYTSFGCSNEPTSPDIMNNFKVNALFDYSLMENDEDDPNFKGDSCRLEHRRRTEGTAVESNYSMEVPVALTRYLRPSLKFDIVTTKTFLAMLCRFIGNEHRFYRFNIERIGNLIIVEEALFGDARPFKTYLQGALDLLTGRANMDYRQVSVCEFGTKRILIRQHVDLAESSSSARIYKQTYWQRSIVQQHSSQNSFVPALTNAISSIAKIEGFINRPDPIFHIDGTNVVIQGPLVPAKPKKPIEVMCRSFQRFSFENLQMKWPNMVFSGADRIISVLHVRGLIDHRPKSFTFEDIAPKVTDAGIGVIQPLKLDSLMSGGNGDNEIYDRLTRKFVDVISKKKLQPNIFKLGYKNTMARASALCRHIFDYIKAIRSPDCDKMALIWVNDKQLPLDVNDGNHLVLYRRHLSGRALDESAFVSPPLHASILRTVQ